MREIQLKDAKANFSKVVDEAVLGTPVVITRHGKKEAVLVSYAEYQRLSDKPSLGWLLASSPVAPGDLATRKKKPARALSVGDF